MPQIYARYGTAGHHQTGFWRSDPGELTDLRQPASYVVRYHPCISLDRLLHLYECKWVYTTNPSAFSTILTVATDHAQELNDGASAKILLLKSRKVTAKCSFRSGFYGKRLGLVIHMILDQQREAPPLTPLTPKNFTRPVFSPKSFRQKTPGWTLEARFSRPQSERGPNLYFEWQLWDLFVLYKCCIRTLKVMQCFK